MVDTLLLRPSLHFTPVHYTCRHFTSSHLNFTQLHFTTVSFGLTNLNFVRLHFTPHHHTSPHITTLHLTSLHCTFRRFSLHFHSFHFTHFIISFLTVSKNVKLTREIPNASAGSWFQFSMFLFTKEYFPLSVICFLSQIFHPWSTLLKSQGLCSPSPMAFQSNVNVNGTGTVQNKQNGHSDQKQHQVRRMWRILL